MFHITLIYDLIDFWVLLLHVAANAKNLDINLIWFSFKIFTICSIWILFWKDRHLLNLHLSVSCKGLDNSQVSCSCHTNCLLENIHLFLSFSSTEVLSGLIPGSLMRLIDWLSFSCLAQIRVEQDTRASPQFHPCQKADWWQHKGGEGESDGAL